MLDLHCFRGLLSSCGVQVSHCSDFFSCGAWALECGLRSCGARAELLRHMWDLPRPGMETVTPAVAES